MPAYSPIIIDKPTPRDLANRSAARQLALGPTPRKLEERILAQCPGGIPKDDHKTEDTSYFEIPIRRSGEIRDPRYWREFDRQCRLINQNLELRSDSRQSADLEQQQKGDDRSVATTHSEKEQVCPLPPTSRSTRDKNPRSYRQRLQDQIHDFRCRGRKRTLAKGIKIATASMQATAQISANSTQTPLDKGL